MSTSAPARAAQPVLLLAMVMVAVSRWPALPSRMSPRTYEAGILVGNGPSVSVGATAQLLAPVPVVPVVLVAGATVSAVLLQAASKPRAGRGPKRRRPAGF